MFTESDSGIKFAICSGYGFCIDNPVDLLVLNYLIMKVSLL